MSAGGVRHWFIDRSDAGHADVDIRVIDGLADDGSLGRLEIRGDAGLETGVKEICM